MRFFVLEADKGYATAAQIVNWYKELDIRDLHEGGYDKIPRRTLLRIQPNEKTVFLDVISSPFFLMTEKIMKCTALYEPNLLFKEMILLDQKNGKTQTYFHPMLRELDCLTENCIFNLDHSELKEIELEEEKTEDKAIFRLSEVKKSCVIVRLDLLESMLRRGAIGFSIREVKVRKGTKKCQNQGEKKNI